jgi:hypothetical protein
MSYRQLVVAAAVGLLPCLATSARAVDYTLTVIADSNGAVDGDATRAYKDFPCKPAIGNTGEVVFYATYDVYSFIDVRASDATTNRLVATSQAGAFSTFYYDPSINNNGRVAFCGYSSTVTAGIFSTDGASVTVIASNATNFGAYTTFASPSINDSGMVAFKGTPKSSSGLGPAGVFVGDGGPITVIANLNNGFTSFNGKPAINNSGNVAFLGIGSAGGLYMGNGGPLTTIANIVGAPYAGFTEPSYNDLGFVGFIADYDVLADGDGVFKSNGTDTTTVVTHVDSPYSDFTNQVAINNCGHVVFRANLAGGGFGLFRGPNATTDKVIKTGDALLGSTVTGIEMQAEGLNDADQVACYVTLANGVKAIVRADPTSPNQPPVCAINGPYQTEWSGTTASVQLTGSGSSDPDYDAITYAWTSDCPGAVFDNASSPDPVLTLTTENPCPLICNVTLTVTDCKGLTSTCTTTVSVCDRTAPTLTVPPDQTIRRGESTDPADTGQATATDTCDANPVITHSDSVAPGECPYDQVITRTWTATDTCGNSASGTQIIAVQEAMAPMLMLPPDMIVACGLPTDPAATGEATAIDNCDPAPVVTYADTETAGTCPQAKVITRTWTATDASGNTISQDQTIEVVDTVPPAITVPADVTLACDLPTDPAATGEATATDNCDPAPTVTYTDTETEGTCPQAKVITRTWTATDACGNAVSQAQTITPQDLTAPVMTVPADTTVECGQSTDPAGTGQATATDNCDPAPAVTHADSVEADPSCPTDSIITRTWTATDACGNSVAQAQTITVQDTTAPVLTLPANAAVECSMPTDPAATGQATAADSCDPAPVVTYSDSVAPDPSCPQQEVITRTWTAADACGNTVSGVQTITVEDTTPPVLVVNTTPITVNDTSCSGNVTVTLPTATATDNCGPATVTNNAPATFPAGLTTVTYTATDTCGNTSTATLDVTVNSAGQAHILVKANRYTLTLGLHPTITKTPLVGITVCAYDRTLGTCAWTTCGGVGPFSHQCIVDNCTPVACGTTDSNGEVTLDVPPGNYVTIGYDSTQNELDHTIGEICGHVNCGQTIVNNLIQIVLATGKHLPGKATRLTGTELLIIEPEYMIWDGTEQQYPFAFESEGDWNITVSVQPPEGFVPDYPSLSETVSNEQKAVQFTITEVGSDLVPTQTTFQVRHKGRLTTVRSNVGIKLTADYAKSRGFDPKALKAKGLIFDKKTDRKPLTALPVAPPAGAAK